MKYSSVVNKSKSEYVKKNGFKKNIKTKVNSEGLKKNQKLKQKTKHLKCPSKKNI